MTSFYMNISDSILNVTSPHSTLTVAGFVISLFVLCSAGFLDRGVASEDCAAAVDAVGVELVVEEPGENCRKKA